MWSMRIVKRVESNVGKFLVTVCEQYVVTAEKLSDVRDMVESVRDGERVAGVRLSDETFYVEEGYVNV